MYKIPTLSASAFISDPFFNMGLRRYGKILRLPPPGRRICFHLVRRLLFPHDLNSRAAAVIWDQGYECPPNLITSAEGQVFSSIQVEMIAIANALDFAASKNVGRLILLYSDSLSSLSHISSCYWKSFLSHTKLRLLPRLQPRHHS